MLENREIYREQWGINIALISHLESGGLREINGEAQGGVWLKNEIWYLTPWFL